MTKKNGTTHTSEHRIAFPFAAFKVRTWVKDAGGTWDPARKEWILPDSGTLAQVEALVEQYEAGEPFDLAKAATRPDADVTRTGSGDLFPAGTLSPSAPDSMLNALIRERDSAQEQARLACADVARLSALMRERDEESARVVTVLRAERKAHEEACEQARAECDRLRALTSPTLNEAAFDALAGQAADAVRKAVRSILTPAPRKAAPVASEAPRARVLDLDDAPKAPVTGTARPILEAAGLLPPKPSRNDAQTMPRPTPAQLAAPPETPAPARVGGLQKCPKCKRFALGSHAC